jgi:hypothetical protein
MMNLSTLVINTAQWLEFTAIVNDLPFGSGFKKVRTCDLPSAIPPSLVEKIRITIFMYDKPNPNKATLIYNCIRLDEKDSALDQQPFGFVICCTENSHRGYCVQHGNWNLRSEKLSTEMQPYLGSTLLFDHFPISGMPKNSSGALSELQETPHELAFKTIIELIPRSNQV